mmetsp:Transcript_17669/g.31912  ORF Transcript_17669/g.31912 Transcript_17669/m.31912 type:complete len:88 (+) Transcript_17669:462-725(+)
MAKSHSELKREQGADESARRSKRVAATIKNKLLVRIFFCGHGASCLGIARPFSDYGYVAGLVKLFSLHLGRKQRMEGQGLKIGFSFI